MAVEMIELTKESVSSKYTVNVAEAILLIALLYRGFFCCARASNPKENIIEGKHAGQFIQRYHRIQRPLPETTETSAVQIIWEMMPDDPPIHIILVMRDLDLNHSVLYHRM